jgi:kynurenine formamidase
MSPTRLSADEFLALAQRIATTATPTPADALAGIATVRSGRVVSAGDQPALPALPEDAAPPRAEPSAYRLTQWTDAAQDWEATNDRLEIDIHGATSMTHIDATSHFRWAGAPHPESGGDALLALAGSGVVGRGVLIDVPGVLERAASAEPIGLADVRESLARSGAEIRAGDTVYIAFGRDAPARSDVPLASVPSAGLSIECAEWLASRSPAAIVTDEGLDPFPSEVDGELVPWHVLVLTVLRIPLVDRARLTELARECRELGRWEFLSILAPLPIPGASGSPLNPLAVF